MAFSAADIVLIHFPMSLMKQYCYVIVSTNGTKHWTRIIAGSEPNMESNWEKENLQRLLANGWRPMRESAMGGSGALPSAFSLLVLERERETETEPAKT